MSVRKGVGAWHEGRASRSKQVPRPEATHAESRRPIFRPRMRLPRLAAGREKEKDGRMEWWSKSWLLEKHDAIRPGRAADGHVEAGSS